jgi:hypothetical protein
VTTDKKKVESALRSKGFKKSDKGHRYFIYYSRDEKKSRCQTMTSQSAKEKAFDVARLRQMAQQCGLNSTEFKNLIECPLTRDAYERLLMARGLI